jgi:hypothetical protein
MKRTRILVPLLFVVTLAFLETPVMAGEAYQEVLADVVVTIFDHERFEKTGWKPKEVTVELPEGNWEQIILKFEAEADEDFWDRLYSVGVDDIELHRGITSFGHQSTTKSHEDVTSYMEILRGTVTFKAILTTYVGAYIITVKLLFYAGTPPAVPDTLLPVWLWQTFRNTTNVQTKSVKFPPAITSGYLVVHATQHSEEEGVVREISVRIDDVEIARIQTDVWFPGQGRVPPYIVDITEYAELLRGVRDVTVEVIEGGNYWKISVAFQLTTKTGK